MTQYALLIYSRDVDWSLPEYADQTKEYGTFQEQDGGSFRGGAALHGAGANIADGEHTELVRF